MTEMPHILMVDDDQDICALVADFLGAQGYRVTMAGDGIAMRQALAADVADRRLHAGGGAGRAALLQAHARLAEC